MTHHHRLNIPRVKKFARPRAPNPHLARLKRAAAATYRYAAAIGGSWPFAFIAGVVFTVYYLSLLLPDLAACMPALPPAP